MRITRKNTKRKITKEVAREVYERDNWQCILCGSHDIDIPHHVFHGSEAQYDEGRNNPDRLVTVCRDCHYTIHFKKGGSQLREECKNYLKNIYGEQN